MALRRILPSVAAALLTATSFAQLTNQDKQDVLEGMDRVLAEQAFVPGVDLGKWRRFVANRQDRLDQAESTREFAGVVNDALREFGISHIKVTPSRVRRTRTWDFSGSVALQRSTGRAYGPQYRWINDDSAFVRLSNFTTAYDREQVETIFETIKDAKRLVLDLRGNPGGEVENMRHFLGMIVPASAPVGTFVSRRMATEFTRAGRGDGNDPVAIAKWADRKFTPRRSALGHFRGEIAVLIDSGSGSASEIVANALREIRQSPVIGAPSAGAVLMSTFERLPHGFMMQFPVSDYVSAGGKRLEGQPIRPDVTLDSTSLGDTQSAATAALDRLCTSR